MLSRYEDRPYLALSLALSKCNCAIETAKQEDIALHQAEKDLLSRLPPSQHKKIASLLPMARLFVDYREHFRYSLLRILLPIHRAILQVGRQLQSSGWINQIGDVMYLQLDDLFWYEQSALAASNFRSKVSEAKELLLQAEHMAFPRVIEGPECAMISLSKKSMRGLESLPPSVIRGIPTSAGVVEGTAVVATDFHTTVLQKGEILVMRAADPGWTSLFASAGGVAMEIGGPLTHGSVIAKELGIPCVSGATGLLSKVQSGMKIRVDGTRGIVEIVDCVVCGTNKRWRGISELSNLAIQFAFHFTYIQLVVVKLLHSAFIFVLVLVLVFILSAEQTHTAMARLFQLFSLIHGLATLQSHHSQTHISHLHTCYHLSILVQSIQKAGLADRSCDDSSLTQSSDIANRPLSNLIGRFGGWIRSD